jgi:hypothetical protein
VVCGTQAIPMTLSMSAEDQFYNSAGTQVGLLVTCIPG